MQIVILMPFHLNRTRKSRPVMHKMDSTEMMNGDSQKHPGSSTQKHTQSKYCFEDSKQTKLACCKRVCDRARWNYCETRINTEANLQKKTKNNYHWFQIVWLLCIFVSSSVFPPPFINSSHSLTHTHACVRALSSTLLSYSRDFVYVGYFVHSVIATINSND